MLFDVEVLRKSSTKFHIKVRISHFKLRKALFKKGLERKFKIKKVLEFDVEKVGGVIFHFISEFAIEMKSSI